MSRRLLFAWFCAAFVALAACGSEPEGDPEGTGGGSATGGSGGDAPGTGGTGGAGGTGGTGGTGGADDLPEVTGFDPPGGTGRGFRVRVLGRNLGRGGPQNVLLFANREGADVPTLEAVGVAASKDGTWFEAVVPMQAHSGPTRVIVDGPRGKITVEGPHFTVTDAALAPTVSEYQPKAITKTDRDVDLTITGANFYVGRTAVYLDDTQLEVDESRSDPTTLVATIPSSLTGEVGPHQLRVETPPPGGGVSGPHALPVVEPLRMVSVTATSANRLRVTFDRPVARQPAMDSDNFRIEGISDAIRWSWWSSGNPSGVELDLRRPLEPATDYVLVVSTKVVSQEGGTLENTRMEFTSWYPDVPLHGEFGGFGCGAEGFADPTGITIAGNLLYVVEREGNQVQVVDLEGNLLGFYGHDGNAFGYHEQGTAAGCGDVDPVSDGLDRPTGGVVVTSNGTVLVGDTEKGRVLSLTAEGATTLVDGLPTPTVLLGFVTGQGLAVTTGPGSFDIFDLATQSSVASHGGEPGTKRGEFDFRMDEGGIPSLAFMSGGFSNYYLFVEPGNHRVSRHRANNFQASGSIGQGARDFFDDASGEAGLEPGSFTGPTGVVVDDVDRTLFVIDSESANSTGGRIQSFSSNGSVVWSIDLGYVPGGIAIDSEQRVLWITNRTEHKLMKYGY